MSWEEQMARCRKIRDEEEEYYKRKCHDKHRHSNKEEADKECERILKRLNLVCQSYECEFCGYWHNGRI